MSKYQLSKHMELCSDIINTIISHLTPYQLENFFIKYNLDFFISFNYDAIPYAIGDDYSTKSLNNIFNKFPNIKVTGLKFYDVLDFKIQKINEVQHLEIYGGDFCHVNFLSKYPNAKSIYFYKCANLVSITTLTSLPKLEYVCFIGCNALLDVKPLNLCKNLKYVNSDVPYDKQIETTNNHFPKKYTTKQFDNTYRFKWLKSKSHICHRQYKRYNECEGFKLFTPIRSGIHVYSSSYNILQVMNGMVGLCFSN